jgi:deoxyribonuclease I
MIRNLFLTSALVTFFSFQSFALTNTTSKTRSVSDSALKDQLHDLAKQNHNALGYNTAKKNLLGYMSVHEVQNKLVVKDVYCEADYASPGLGRIPSNSVINTEHTWPQSKFGGIDRRFQKSDLHHLYPTDSELNSIRGNNPFGEVVQDTQNTKCPQSHIGYNSVGQRAFEPPQDHKGNAARAIFYFSIRYKMKIDDAQESDLKKWNLEDPVDAAELLRNEQVEGYQGNRNPFIDQPDLANQVLDF